MSGDRGPWLTGCPECGDPAEVVVEGLVGSTHGPVEVVRVRCVRRHWFLMDASGLETPVAATEPDRAAGRR